MGESPHDMDERYVTQQQKAAEYPRDFIKLKSPSGSEDVHYSIFYEDLPEEYRLLAQKELNETEDDKKIGLKKLKAFIEKEKLQPCRDYEIIGALRNSKYKLKEAEAKLQKYLKFRQKTVRLLAGVDDTKAELILKDALFSFLPYRDKHGRAVIVTQANVHLDLYEMEDLQPFLYAAFLYVYTFPLTTVCGLSCIMDYKTDNLYVLYPAIRCFRGYINDMLSFPVRHGRLDGMNENKIVSLCYAVLRPILPEKIKTRIAFHGKEYGNLKNIYHPDLLPKEFEGNLEPITNKYLTERFLNFIKKLKAENEITEHANG